MFSNKLKLREKFVFRLFDVSSRFRCGAGLYFAVTTGAVPSFTVFGMFTSIID